MVTYWRYCTNGVKYVAMIKDELYPDYEEHHIEILSELDSDDVIETPENSKGDCLVISIVVTLLIVAAILFTVV